MRICKSIFLFTLTALVMVVIMSCTRAYPNGDTEEINLFNAIIDFIVGLPEAPEGQQGILALLTGGLTLSGLGWVKAILNKKTIEKGRDMVNGERVISNTRYQAIKEGLRDNPKTLAKVKVLAGEGVEFAKDNMDMLKEHADDLGTFLTKEEQGRKLPAFLAGISEHLRD